MKRQGRVLFCLALFYAKVPRFRIAILATLASGDDADNRGFTLKDIAIHATLTSGDCRPCLAAGSSLNFNPRHSREWRRGAALHTQVAKDFNPRHSREWRQAFIKSYVGVCLISIHATLASGDNTTTTNAPNAFISIHATLASGDTATASPHRPQGHFNPRHSREWRQESYR